MNLVFNAAEISSSVISVVSGLYFKLCEKAALNKDNDFAGLFWLYLIANEEVLNTNTHPVFGYYWEIVPDNCPYIRLLSRATIS